MSSLTARVNKQKPKVTRSRSGCINCRKRKKKCDEIKPICTGCFKRNWVCLYKEPTTIQSTNNNITEDKSQVISNQTHELVSTLATTSSNIINQSDTIQLPITTIVCEDIVGTDVMNLLLEYRTHGDEVNRTYFDVSPLFFTEERAGISELRYRQINFKTNLPTPLTEIELSYLEFFCKKVLPELSTITRDLNHYSKIFVSMALKYKLILYAIVTWGCKMMKNDGLNYQFDDQEVTQYLAIIDNLIEENNRNLTKDSFFINFVTHMIVVLMEVSTGETSNWSSHFSRCFNMIERMPGRFRILLTNYSEEGRMLAENFAYIDIMASQSNENGALYPMSTYEELFSVNDNIKALHDPMQGCIRPLICLLGRILELLVNSNALHLTFDLTESDKFDVISDVLAGADKLDQQIKEAKPDLTFIQYSNSKSPNFLENHLMLFECYQLSSQIYLRQVIRKLPSSVPEIGLLAFRLRGDIRLLVKADFLKKSLAFPMLILGLCSTSREEKKEFKELLDYLVQICGYMCSYQKLLYVIERIWDVNQEGKVYVDWYDVTRRMGWRLNLGR